MHFNKNFIVKLFQNYSWNSFSKASLMSEAPVTQSQREQNRINTSDFTKYYYFDIKIIGTLEKQCWDSCFSVQDSYFFQDGSPGLQLLNS